MALVVQLVIGVAAVLAVVVAPPSAATPTATKAMINARLANPRLRL